VGATSELPLSGQHSDDPFHIPGRSYGPSEFDDAQFRQVTPGYLAAMRIPLLAGRWLDELDHAGSAGVVVVNQEFVARFFAGGGRPREAPPAHGRSAGNARNRGSGREYHTQCAQRTGLAGMYVPYAQFAPPSMNIVVRAAADPMNLAAALRDRVSAVDKNETLSAPRSMDDVLGASLSQPRFSSQTAWRVRRTGTGTGRRRTLRSHGLFHNPAQTRNRHSPGSRSQA